MLWVCFWRENDKDFYVWPGSFPPIRSVVRIETCSIRSWILPRKVKLRPSYVWPHLTLGLSTVHNDRLDLQVQKCKQNERNSFCLFCKILTLHQIVGLIRHCLGAVCAQSLSCSYSVSFNTPRSMPNASQFRSIILNTSQFRSIV